MLQKETAIDWLVERINHAKIEKILTTQRLYELKKIAKQIEKKQVIDAFNFGVLLGKINTYSTAEQYYNETYED